MQRFLGAMNYDRIFVAKITETLESLYRVLSGKRFLWDEEQSKASNTCKMLWKKDLELIVPNMNKDLLLEANA